MFCQQCGAQIDDKALFCNNCGTRTNNVQQPVQQQPVQQPVYQQPMQQPYVQAQPKKKVNGKLIAIIGGAVAVVAAIVVAIILIQRVGAKRDAMA